MYAIVLLIPIIFLPKGSVLIEAEISFIEVPKVALFRLLMAISLPFIILLVLKYGRDVRFNAIFVLVTLFTIWYMITTIFSQSPGISYWGEFSGQDSYSSLGAGYYYILFVAVVVAFRNRTHINRLFWMVSVSGALVSIPIILQEHQLALLSIIPQGVGRPPGTFGNPVFAGAFLSLSIMCTVIIITQKMSLSKLILLAGLATVQVLALMYTETRASILALTVFLICFWTPKLIRYKSREALLAAIGFAVVITALFASQGGLTRFQSTLDELPNRVKYWNGAIELASRSPIFGLGPDTFRYYYLRISPPSEIGLPEEPDHAHSWYFHHLAETGYVGAVLATAITSVPVIVSPSLAAVFLGRSAEQIVGVGRISDISLLYILLGVAYHESRFSIRDILRNIARFAVTNTNRLRSFRSSS